MEFCGENVLLRSQSPEAIFFTKFGMGEGVPDLHPTPNITIVAFKMWPYGPKNRQNC